MQREILISAHGLLPRAALLEDNELAEVYYDANRSKGAAGQIYKGCVSDVLPGMQAAFVNIGAEKNAFLYIDEVDKRNRPKQTPIEQLLHPGDEIIVQVSKEAVGTKGPRVTEFVSLPGRYLVLSPKTSGVGISRKITSKAERMRLRQTMARLCGESIGLIVRTAARFASEEECVLDFERLKAQWETIVKKAERLPAPALLYEDESLTARALRDFFSSEVVEVVVDDPAALREAKALISDWMPEWTGRLTLFHGNMDLFEQRGIDQFLNKALRRKIWLRSGGYLIIDHTEACTVIDVNTGKFTGRDDLGETILRTNLEAAAEIARQLRLRDVGGIILVDFIDMKEEAHRRAVLKALEVAAARDRTHVHVLGLTKLGIVEMTRKKGRQSLDEVVQRVCPLCEGSGRVKEEHVVAADVEQALQRLKREQKTIACAIRVHPLVGSVLIGQGGRHLQQLEQQLGLKLFIRGDGSLRPDLFFIQQYDDEALAWAEAVPVSRGETYSVLIETQHHDRPEDGIARINGFVIEVSGAGERIGQQVRIRVDELYKTHAHATLVADG